MSKLARNVIEAIQHSLLGDLAWRLLWPLGFLAALALDHLNKGRQGPLTVGLFATIFVYLAAMWIVGVLAKPAFPRDAQPANGFEAWKRAADSQLNPPRPIRRLVEIFGVPSAVLAVLFMVTWFAAGLGVITLVVAPDAFLVRHSPFVAAHQRGVIYALLGLLLLTDIRLWAIRNRPLVQSR